MPKLLFKIGASQDVPPPKFGPAFAGLSAWPYRLEMALAFLGLLVVLFYWRLFVVGDLDVPVTVFWLLWPDLLAFIPIGLAMRKTTTWPSWGPVLYNIPHSFLVWLAVFAVWSLVAGAIVWPLLGWAAHISVDRATGYYLRAR